MYDADRLLVTYIQQPTCMYSMSSETMSACKTPFTHCLSHVNVCNAPWCQSSHERIRKLWINCSFERSIAITSLSPAIPSDRESHPPIAWSLRRLQLARLQQLLAVLVRRPVLGSSMLSLNMMPPELKIKKIIFKKANYQQHNVRNNLCLKTNHTVLLLLGISLHNACARGPNDTAGKTVPSTNLANSTAAFCWSLQNIYVIYMVNSNPFADSKVYFWKCSPPGEGNKKAAVSIVSSKMSILQHLIQRDYYQQLSNFPIATLSTFCI